MTLDEARTILTRQAGLDRELGPEYVHRAYAAEVVGNHYRAHPELTKPVTFRDAARRP